MKSAGSELRRGLNISASFLRDSHKFPVPYLQLDKK